MVRKKGEEKGMLRLWQLLVVVVKKNLSIKLACTLDKTLDKFPCCSSKKFFMCMLLIRLAHVHPTQSNQS